MKKNVKYLRRIRVCTPGTKLFDDKSTSTEYLKKN